MLEVWKLIVLVKPTFLDILVSYSLGLAGIADDIHSERHGQIIARWSVYKFVTTNLRKPPKQFPSTFLLSAIFLTP